MTEQRGAAETGDSTDAESRATGWTSVFAPATVANVGPGFDCFGFALETPGDTVHVRATPSPGVRIASITGDGGALPRDPEANTAAVAAAAIWRDVPTSFGALGIELRIEKGLPAGSGLGSGAASAAAGAVAAMKLAAQVAGQACDEDRVLAAALDGEAVASGARHADNVAPALRGGFTIVQPASQGAGPPVIARFLPALPLQVAVVTPNLEISTREARAALPQAVPLEDAVANWSAAATLVFALMSGDAGVLRSAFVDRVVTPCRATLIPGFDAAREAAIDAGALGCSISGSGPSLFALAIDEPAARAAADAMTEVLAGRGLECARIVSPISPRGARVP